MRHVPQLPHVDREAVSIRYVVHGLAGLKYNMVPIVFAEPGYHWMKKNTNDGYEIRTSTISVDLVSQVIHVSLIIEANRNSARYPPVRLMTVGLGYAPV